MTALREVVIVDAVRTGSGRRGGALAGCHPVDLAGGVLGCLSERVGLYRALIDDVVLGCVTQVNEQSTNIARNAVLAAGWPQTVPGTTVDRQCGSSQQAMHFAAQAIRADSCDIVVAAGVEHMTTVPLFSNASYDLHRACEDVAHSVVVSDRFRHDDHRGRQAVEAHGHVMAIAPECFIRAGQYVRASLSRQLD